MRFFKLYCLIEEAVGEPLTPNEKRIIRVVCASLSMDVSELKDEGFEVSEIKSAVYKSKGVLEYNKAQRFAGDKNNMNQFGRNIGSGGSAQYVPAHVAVSRAGRNRAAKIAALR